MNNKLPTPLFDYVMILPEKEDKKEQKGYFVPDDLQPKPSAGKVVAVGKGVQAEDTGAWIEVQVKKGDIVGFQKFKGAPIVIDDIQYLLLRQSELSLIF